VVLGFGEEGELVALEVWEASKRELLKTLRNLANEKRDLVEALLKKRS